jgi:hypothetical protein
MLRCRSTHRHFFWMLIKTRLNFLEYRLVLPS